VEQGLFAILRRIHQKKTSRIKMNVDTIAMRSLLLKICQTGDMNMNTWDIQEYGKDR